MCVSIRVLVSVMGVEGCGVSVATGVGLWPEGLICPGVSNWGDWESRVTDWADCV